VKDCRFPNVEMPLVMISINVNADLAVFADLGVELWSTPPAHPWAGLSQGAAAG
jgi:hypothetical protein